jgi:hypothetical protein
VAKLEPNSDVGLAARAQWLLEACQAGGDARAIEARYRAQFPSSAR